MAEATDSRVGSEVPVTTRSLTRRAVSIVLAAQLGCAIVLCTAAFTHERHTRFRAFDTRLQGRSDSLLGAIQDAEDPEDNVTVDPTELDVPKQDVYAVYGQDGRLLGASADAPPALIARGKNGFRDVRWGRRSYRVLQREALRIIDRAENGGVGLRRPVTILYASPEGHVWREAVEAARFYLVTIAVAATATVLLVLLLLRRELRPLGDLAEAAAHLSAPALTLKAPASALELRELRPLADVLESAVSRLRESFAKEHRFVGDAAHELKTAIAVIQSSVQVLMLKRRSSEEYMAGLGRILEDTRRAEALVTQMLLLARLEESATMDVPPLDVSSLLRSVAAQLQPVAAQHGVTIWLQSSPDLLVRLQPESAEVLVSNLLMNAVQHSRPHTSVLLSASPADGGRIRLEVVDHGHGISPEALPHIFERFYREDASRSRETGGTGLGLAICKCITDAVGAAILVESTTGIGTRVEVTFSPA